MAAFDDIDPADPLLGVEAPEPPPPSPIWEAIRQWWLSVCGPKQAGE